MTEHTDTLLIVDDNESNRDLLSRRMKRKGFDVATAVDGADALEIMKKRRFDLVLLDLMMPGISGLEVLERVRKDFSPAELPVIMVTAHHETSAIVGSLELGANDYVTKPVDIPVLLARVNAQLDRMRAEAAVKEANESLEKQVIERTAELQRANETLRTEISDRTHAEERVRLLLESTAEAILGIDLDGKCIFCNPSCAQMLGYDETAELLGRTITGLALPGRSGESAGADGSDPIVQAARDGTELHAAEQELSRRDGTSFPAEYWVHPMQRDGEHVGAVVTFIDITERKRLDQGLREAQKLSAVGELAGGIAHEFNNLLMIIGGYVHNAVRNADDPEALRTDLRQTEKATKRAAALTKRLLVFSREQQFEHKIIDVTEMLAGIKDWLHPLLGEQYTLEIDAEDRQAFTDIDPDQLTQSLVNLVINARDATPGGGEVVVGSKLVDLEADSLAARGVEVAPGSYISIFVKDFGTGIDEETVRRIFEPFFTTKAPGSGTGLGLAMIYGFVKSSNGYIDVQSTVGSGSTFTLYFPVTEARPAPAMEMEDDLPAGRGEVILLVEDEDALRDLLADNLTRLGYDVLTARDGPVALEIEEDYEGPIDLLLSDVVMPSFGGVEVANALRQTRPDTKVILMSGYPTHGIAKDTVLPQGITFLSKPVDPNLLARKIREELDHVEHAESGEPAVVAGIM